MQRDLNKIISLLLSPQYNRQNPSEKRRTKWVRKCVGNEVRHLKQASISYTIMKGSWNIHSLLQTVDFFGLATRGVKERDQAERWEVLLDMKEPVSSA